MSAHHVTSLIAEKPAASDTLLRRTAEGSSPRQPTRSTTLLRLSAPQLVALARAATPGVEEHIYARLAPAVNRLVWALLGADDEHNDLVHEIFIQIFRNVGKLRDPESLDAWAARVAINTVRNEIRKRRLRRWVFWSPFEDPGLLQHVADLDGRELLVRAFTLLAKLPTDERLILSLRLFETGTLDELAVMAGWSLTTAKRRLRKARERVTRLAHSDPLLKDWIGRESSPSFGGPRND